MVIIAIILCKELDWASFCINCESDVLWAQKLAVKLYGSVLKKTVLNFGIAHVHSCVSIQNIIVFCITILVLSGVFIWLALTRFPQETTVTEPDRPDDLTGHTQCRAPTLFHPVGLTIWNITSNNKRKLKVLNILSTSINQHAPKDTACCFHRFF
jgi:hypothetical protein